MYNWYGTEYSPNWEARAVSEAIYLANPAGKAIVFAQPAGMANIFAHF